MATPTAWSVPFDCRYKGESRQREEPWLSVASRLSDTGTERRGREEERERSC